MCLQPPPTPKASIHPQGWWPPSGLPELVEPISLSPSDGTAATTARGIRARVQEALTQGKEGRAAPSSFPLALESSSPACHGPVRPSLRLRPLLIQRDSAGQHWSLSPTSAADWLCV